MSKKEKIEIIVRELVQAFENKDRIRTKRVFKSIIKDI